MNEFVIGIDGGGTGSKGFTADVQGNVLEKFVGGATNYNGASQSEVDDTIRRLLQQALNGRQTGDCRAICFGTAGLSNQQVAAHVKEVILEEGFTCPILITGDMETALAGALSNREGIVLIAGTGAICFGKKADGATYRCGGYGHLIDDGGSAYDISRRILSSVVCAADGRQESTCLCQLVYDYLGVSCLGDVITWLYAKERTKSQIASLAVLLEQAVQKEDPTALRIVEEVASCLADLASPVVKFFDGRVSLAVSGSVLQKNLLIREKFCAQMQRRFPKDFGSEQGVCIVSAEHEADYGAVLLALAYDEKGGK